MFSGFSTEEPSREVLTSAVGDSDFANCCCNFRLTWKSEVAFVWDYLNYIPFFCHNKCHLMFVVAKIEIIFGIHKYLFRNLTFFNNN